MAKSIFKCKICGEKYTTLEGLYSHLEEEHSSSIPSGMSVGQYYYYLKTGKEYGNCVVCKGKTPWNEKTKKYHRFCGDPACKAKYKETVDQRMIGKYGKVNLLNDPEQQRKMLMGRSISGEYNYAGIIKPYVGSYELDFLKTMDLFFDWDPRDIEMPSPHTYYYNYEGEQHFYIPDAFIYSLGLEIEIKDGGNNPNMHHKIQDVDKEKERLKDEVMHNQKLHHYIKLTNKNYWNLFEFFRISKEHVEKYGDYEKIPKIILDEDIGAKKISSNSRSIMKEEANKAVNETMEIIDERYVFDKKNSYINFDLFENGESNICLITGLSGSGKSTLSKEICKEHNAYCIELDIFEHPDMELDPDVKRPNDLYINYFKRRPGLKNKLINNDLNNIELSKEVCSFLDYSIEYCKSHPKDKFVIEGLQIFADVNPENVKGLPIIFVNTSMINSMVRKYKRDGVKYKVSDLFKWYTEDEKNYRQFKHDISVSEGFNHFITLGLNKKMNRGLYSFIDNKSYIIYDDIIQLKRVNNVMQPLTENFELNDDIDIIRFGINKDVNIQLESDMNQGAFLHWNRNDDIDTLLENISAELFNSELTIDDFHRIEGDE